jgi:hypothetical protein
MTIALSTTHRLALAALATLALIARPANAQPAPYHRWRTLDTPHFRVHVPAGLEREGRVAGAAAEQAYEQLAKELTPPREPIELVVSDDADYSNGYATPFPSPRIVVYATPPVESPALRLNEDWLGIVITHELTHIFHLDRVRGVWAGAQRIFGRAPFLFPHIYEPSWLTEGLAVYYESRLTEGGRLRDAEHRTIARSAALEGVLPRLGDLSAGSPRFPRGELTYSYGSLFVDWLARTHGDSTIGRFVEIQSGQLNPFALGKSSRKAFDISFVDAFDMWRDSVKRSAPGSTPPLASWRELSTHGYYAASPRWTSDSSLVYTASDGRTVNSAYELTTTGARRRLGRRNSDGANVPLADGGLLYAQPEIDGTTEVRSDLYVQRGGRVRRLTYGARLVQPDARRDGTIVAVRLAPTRASLVLLDAEGQLLRVLREAGPDETWSEPRWSPDGSRIAVAHRAHGGIFSIEVIDPSAGGSAVAALESFLLSSPAWSPDGTLWYVSERTGSPALEAWSGGTLLRRPAGSDSTLVALATPDVSPRGTALTAVSLRADGYHVGVAPLPRLDTLRGASAPGLEMRPVADTQMLAAGDFVGYSPWRSLRPRYWMPLIESAPDRGTRLGAITSGYDVLRRHEYIAYAAIPTSGRFYTGGLAYRYAGLRRPFIDVSLSQDWESSGLIYAADMIANPSAIGRLYKRTRDLSLAATLSRPRYRTNSSLTMGVAVERRHFDTEPVELLRRVDASFRRDYTFPRAFLGGSWGNYQRPFLSISPEDGVALAFTARERLLTGTSANFASASVVGTMSAYRSLDMPGYAHSVLALRVAGGVADPNTPTAFEVGGTSGTSAAIAGYAVSEGRRTFGVRGFPAASIYGTSAAAASLEYRAPLLLGGKGLRSFPLFFDRSSVSAFADAGTAGCAARPLFQGICSPAGIIGHTIASVGAELGVSLALLTTDQPELLRFGVAFPVLARGSVARQVERVSGYVELGVAF